MAEYDFAKIEKKLSKYLVQVSSLSLTEQQHMVVNHLFYTVSDIERIGDHATNIAEWVIFALNDKKEIKES